MTVAALARGGRRVARNAIYTNHRDILDDLARARKRGAIPDRLGSVEHKVAEQRAVIGDMQLQIRQLVTENAGLCDARSRRNAWPEMADRRNAQLTKQIDVLRRPAVLRPTNA